MNNLLSDLRHITATAKEDKIAAQALLDEKIKKRMEDERQAGLRLCQGLVDKLKLAAAHDQEEYIVVKLQSGSEAGWADVPLKHETNKPYTRAELGVKAKAAYDYCQKELGLPVILRYNHDGVGESSWVELVVSWKPEPPQARH
jgi:hypothetical protein